MKILDKFFNLVGKVVVSAGGFIGFFYIVSMIVKFLSPIVNGVCRLINANLNIVFSSFFILFLLVLAVSIIKEKGLFDK